MICAGASATHGPVHNLHRNFVEPTVGITGSDADTDGADRIRRSRRQEISDGHDRARARSDRRSPTPDYCINLIQPRRVITNQLQRSLVGRAFQGHIPIGRLIREC